MPPSHEIDRELLFIWADKKRRSLRLGWKEVAEQTGISPSSLTRWQYGGGLSADAVASLIVWSDCPPAIIIRRRKPSTEKRIDMA